MGPEYIKGMTLKMTPMPGANVFNLLISVTNPSHHKGRWEF